MYNKQPRAIDVDKNPAYPAAIKELKQEEILFTDCKLRQKKYFNNIKEQLTAKGRKPLTVKKYRIAYNGLSS